MSVGICEPMNAGFYGKLPGLGDFVSRGLSRGCVRDIDRWLQGGMLALREAGTCWRDAYEAAPTWMFLQPCGQFAATPLGGVVVASTDRVGRHFPFVACVTPTAGFHAESMARVAGQVRALASVLPDWLVDCRDADHLLQQFGEWAVGAEAVPPDPAATARFAEDADYSLWWSLDRQRQSSPLVQSGLPDASLFVRLFGPGQITTQSGA